MRVPPLTLPPPAGSVRRAGRPACTGGHGRHAWALVAALWLAMSGPDPAASHPHHHEQIQSVDSLLARSPNDAALLRRRAEWMRLAGDFEAARRSLQDAERGAPGDPWNALASARLDLERGLPAPARMNADRAVARMPRVAEAWLVRAAACEALGDLATAAADLDRAIALAARPRPEDYLHRARVCEALGDPERALLGLDEAASRLGPTVVLEREAIELEMRLQRPDAALARFDRLAPQYAREDVALVERGDLLARAGRLPAAMSAWTEALERIAARAERPFESDAVRAGGIEARLQQAALALGLEP